MRRWIGIGIATLLALGSLVALFTATQRSETTGRIGVKAATSGSASRTLAQGAKSAVAAKPSGGASSSVSADAGAPPLAKSATVPASGTNALVASDRVVKHATLDVTVGAKQFGDQVAKAHAIAGLLGGYVEQSDQGRGLASITMRVPVARFDDALARLGGLGRVTDRSERGDDASAQFSDLEARIRNLTAQEGVLQDLMRQARSIADTITVQQQLSQVRGEIEQLTGQRNLLDNQTSLATVAAALHVRGVAPVRSHKNRGTLGQAWHDAVGVAVAIVGGTIVVLGALIPLGLLAALIAGGWAIARRRRPRLEPAGV